MTVGTNNLPTEEQLDGIVSVLDAVRSGLARTKPEITRRTGLGRNSVTQWVNQLVAIGLLEEQGFAASSGGRNPRALRFGGDAGQVLVANLGTRHLIAGSADLLGNITARHREPCDVAEGPKVVLNRVCDLFDRLLSERASDLWGIGIGLPGPVDFSSARTIAPPIMPGWDRYDVRGHLVDRFGCAVWVDNDVNLMVIGEARDGLARGENDVVYIKIGTGIGAGLISNGRIHRGAQGCAGDIGHIRALPDSTVPCRCGQLGCLEALAGAAALIDQAQQAGNDGRSSYLAGIVRNRRAVTLTDISDALAHGDTVVRGLVVTGAQLVADAAARIVNFYNPGLILIGGSVAHIGDIYLSTIRQTVLARSLPLATRDLRIARSPQESDPGLTGGAFMVIDELLSRGRIGRWIRQRTPVGRPDLVF
jgi:predicted NBD/HSP70 family sugar kinase